MCLIDDNYIKTILESDIYTLPLKEHKRETIKKIILLVINLISYVIATIISCIFLKEKPFYIEIGKPIFITLILGMMLYIIILAIKGFFLF